MSFLQLRGLSKHFRDTVAVDEIDLEVDDGEFLVLLGPSGCGKTTTLRMIAGLEVQTHGEILLGGENISDVPPEKRDVAMVFQNLALYPHMTVFENIAFNLRNRGTDEEQVRQRVEEVTETVEIGPLLERLPNQLSGGQQQRVALARAMVRGPKLFLLDEPLAALDAKLRTTMRSELKLLHSRLLRGTDQSGCFIYVTHDQEEALTLGTRVVVMNEGEIVQVDPPEQLYERPSHHFTAGFIGSPAMNLLEGRLEHDDGRRRFVNGDLSVDLGAAPTDETPPDRPVTLGVRPEALDLVEGAEATDTDIPCEVVTVEFLGQTRLVLVEVDDLVLKVLGPGRWDVEEGEQRHLRVPIDTVHLFDENTGERLDLGTDGDGDDPTSTETAQIGATGGTNV